MAKILIAGCGKIGSALADVLSSQGHELTGIKRKPHAAASIRCMTADISSAASLAGLDNDFTQAFFIVTPDQRTEQSYRSVYEKGLSNLLAKLPDANWLMASSTSVYGQSGGEWVDESSATQPGAITGRIIRQAEQQLTALNPANIVVRFSGIYGPGRDRLLSQAMQSPSIQQSPPYYTNRIHQQDCVAVMAFLLERLLAGEVLDQYYVATDDTPAPLWEVVSWLADRLKCRPPTALTDGNALNKRCSNARLKTLGYRFHYPGFKDGYSNLVAAAENGKVLFR